MALQSRALRRRCEERSSTEVISAVAVRGGLRALHVAAAPGSWRDVTSDGRARSPRSRALRHAAICEEYRPSRRRSAPTSELMIPGPRNVGKPRLLILYRTGMFDDAIDGDGAPLHITPFFRTDLAAPWAAKGRSTWLKTRGRTFSPDLQLAYERAKLSWWRARGKVGVPDDVEEMHESVTACTLSSRPVFSAG